MRSYRLAFAAPALAFVVILLSGCEGPDRRAMIEEARHSVPPMAADESYFDGQIAVHLNLSGGGREAILPGEKNFKGNTLTSIGNGSMGEGNFGGAMDGGAMGRSQVASETDGDSKQSTWSEARKGAYQGNEGMGHVMDSDDSESVYERRRREAEMPGALMRLRLENTSAATVIVEIRDVNSDLGNFAVRPATVTLNPGQTLETDPMLSKLGVDSYSLPVTITLRAGGKTESKTLTLRLIKPDPAPPSAAPAR